MEQDTEETPVVFRMMHKRHGGYVLALFPAEAYSVTDTYLCSSYAHVGQHGCADPGQIVAHSRAATPAEYADLKAELEGAPFGYRLRVYQRVSRRFDDARFRQVMAWRHERRQ